VFTTQYTISVYNAAYNQCLQRATATFRDLGIWKKKESKIILDFLCLSDYQ